MIIGYLGDGALCKKVRERLSAAFDSVVLLSVGTAPTEAEKYDVLVVGGSWPSDALETLTTMGVFARSSANMPIVVDQTSADPEKTRALSIELAAKGVQLVDAPIHCELASDFPKCSAILCGGADAALERVRPVLEAMGPKLIHFGEVGSGHTAHALVTAIAVCNRMITYECAALGVKNGLTIEDMSTVLNHSSGANSASERVLPFLASRDRTTDIPIADVAAELRVASQLAMRAGATAMLPMLVADMTQSFANELDAAATFDDVVGLLDRRGRASSAL